MYRGPSGPRMSPTTWTSSARVVAALKIAATMRQVTLLALIDSFPDSFIGSRSYRQVPAVLSRSGNFQTGFAQPLKQMLNEFSVIPLTVFLSRYRAEVRHDRMQFPQRRTCTLLFAKLAIDSSQRGVRPIVARHVDLQSACQCVAIVTPAVGIVNGEIMIPARMMWV